MHTKTIFLSANISMKSRENFASTDVLACRDCIIAFADSVISEKQYRAVLDSNNVSVYNLIKNIIKHNLGFFDENKIIGYNDVQELEETLKNTDCCACVIVNGDKKTIAEHEIFTKTFPKSPVYPVASTGGVAMEIYEKSDKKYNRELIESTLYNSLFKDILHL